MPSHNPYDLLGVDPGAGTDDIRAAYRRRAAQVHPDRQPPEHKEPAAEAMRQLNDARDLLLDPRRRAALDARLRQASAAAGFADLYAELLRERRARQRRRRAITQVTWALILGLAGGLTIVAPGAVLLTIRVIAGLAAFWFTLFIPVLIAFLLAMIFVSFRRS